MVYVLEIRADEIARFESKAKRAKAVAMHLKQQHQQVLTSSSKRREKPTLAAGLSPVDALRADAAPQAGVLPLRAPFEDNTGRAQSESEDEHSSIDDLSPEELRRRLRIANSNQRARDFKEESEERRKKQVERKENRKEKQQRRRRESSSSEHHASSDEHTDAKDVVPPIKRSELSITALNFSKNFEAENIDKYAQWTDDAENDVLKALGKEGKAAWAKVVKNLW